MGWRTNRRKLQGPSLTPPFPQTAHRWTSEERLAAVQLEGSSTCPDWEEDPISQTNPKLCEGSVSYCHTAIIGKLSLRRQRTVGSFPPADLASRLQKAGTDEAQGPIPTGRRWRRGRARTSNRGRALWTNVVRGRAESIRILLKIFCHEPSSLSLNDRLRLTDYRKTKVSLAKKTVFMLQWLKWRQSYSW